MTTDAVGGVWRYTIELCHGLTAQGWRVRLAVLGPPPTTEQAAELPDATEWHVTGLPLDWLAARPQDLGGAELAARSVGCDVALLHAPALLGDAAWPLPVAVMVHSCLATWFAAVRGGAVPGDYTWRAGATAYGLRRARTIAAPSRTFAEALCRTHGVTDIRTIHNGRAPLALPKVARERRVFTAGRLWDDGKNVATLDAAAAALDAPVRAAGSLRGPDGSQARLRAITALGSLGEGELAREYAGAAVFASAARYEPFGLAVLEAAQAGCALVLADIPTFRELWEGAAVFVPATDASAWTSALGAMLAAPAAWAARARRRAERYTREAMAQGTLGLLAAAMA